MGIEQMIIERFTKQAKKEGKIEGEKRTKITTIKNLRLAGVSIETIAIGVEMKAEEVRKILDELKIA